MSGPQVMVDVAELEAIKQRIVGLQATVTALLRRGSPFEVLSVRDVASRYHVGAGRVLAAISGEQLPATKQRGRGGFVYRVTASAAHHWYERHVAGVA